MPPRCTYDKYICAVVACCLARISRGECDPPLGVAVGALMESRAAHAFPALFSAPRDVHAHIIWCLCVCVCVISANPLWRTLGSCAVGALLLREVVALESVY